MSSEEVQRSSEERTEELLLPEGVLRSGHRSDEGILTSVGITVSHQVCCCLGHLYPAQAGLNLKLFHHLACLANTHSAVNGGLPFHPGVKTDNSVPSAEALGSSATTQLGLCPNILCPQYLHSPVAIPPPFFLSGENGEDEMKCSPNPGSWSSNDLRILSLRAKYVTSNKSLSQKEPHPDEITSATCPLKP